MEHHCAFERLGKPIDLIENSGTFFGVSGKLRYLVERCISADVLPSCQIMTAIDGYPKKPGAFVLAVAEMLSRCVKLQKHILHDIQRIVVVPKVRECDTVQQIGVGVVCDLQSVQIVLAHCISVSLL